MDRGITNNVVGSVALAVCAASITGIMLMRRRRRQFLGWQRRRFWTKPINMPDERIRQGDFENLFTQIKRDPGQFFKFTRMDVVTWNCLLKLVGPHLQKRSRREFLSPEHRLAITIRYLATGDEVKSVALCFRVGRSTAFSVIYETCQAIYKALQPTYLPSELSPEKWLSVKEDFWQQWQFPNCVGALDGKLIKMQCPPNSDSASFNYKKFFSVNLLALCDAKYKFLMVDIGSYGSSSDATIFRNSTFGTKVKNGSANIPQDSFHLPISEVSLPLFFVGDKAFQLEENIMRPFPGINLPGKKSIFNYRLSRARRTIENSFGILTSRWRVLRKEMCCEPTNCEKIALACITLHNFLMESKNEDYCSPSYVDHENQNGVVVEGEWRSDGRGLEDNPAPAPHRAAARAYAIRDVLTDYFCSSGAVPCQWDLISRGCHWE